LSLRTSSERTSKPGIGVRAIASSDIVYCPWRAYVASV